VESVSTSVIVISAEDGSLFERVAQPLLNIIPAGVSMPVAVYFPPPFPTQYQARLELRSALPLPADDARYLPAHLQNWQVQINSGGMSALLEGEIVLDLEDGAGGTTWVLVAAYNSKGEVIGVRRWESPAVLMAGQPLPFSIIVYSAADNIVSVNAFVEARR